MSTNNKTNNKSVAIHPTWETVRIKAGLPSFQSLIAVQAAEESKDRTEAYHPFTTDCGWLLYAFAFILVSADWVKGNIVVLGPSLTLLSLILTLIPPAFEITDDTGIKLVQAGLWIGVATASLILFSALPEFFSLRVLNRSTYSRTRLDRCFRRCLRIPSRGVVINSCWYRDLASQRGSNNVHQRSVEQNTPWQCRICASDGANLDEKLTVIDAIKQNLDHLLRILAAERSDKLWPIRLVDYMFQNEIRFKLSDEIVSHAVFRIGRSRIWIIVLEGRINLLDLRLECDGTRCLSCEKIIGIIFGGNNLRLSEELTLAPLSLPQILTLDAVSHIALDETLYRDECVRYNVDIATEGNGANVDSNLRGRWIALETA